MADYPCWLLRHVLLEGRLYVTNNDVCFTAYLPVTQGKNMFSGTLSKMARRSSRSTRHWFVLRPDQLAYYNSAQDLYFPTGVIDLRYTFSADLIPDGSSGDKFQSNMFQVVTERRTYNFKADTASSAQLWVKCLQRAIFMSRNEGGQVKIKIPVENIIDLEESNLHEFGVALKVRAIDSEDTFSIDEYVLAFINPHQTSEVPINTIRKVMDQKGIKDIDPEIGADKIYEELAESRRILGRITDSTNTPPSPTTPTRSRSPVPMSPSDEPGRSVVGVGRRFTRRVKNFVGRESSSSPSVSRSASPNGSGHIGNVGVPVKATLTPPAIVVGSPPNKDSQLATSQDSFLDVAQGDYVEPSDDNYAAKNQVQIPNNSSHSTNFLPSLHFGRSHTVGFEAPEKKKKSRGTMVGKVSDMFTSSIKHFQPPTPGEFTDFEDAEKYQVSAEERTESNDRFRQHFSFGEDEELTASYYAHIQKPIPIYGKIYVSNNYVCFRSLLIGTKTKMVLPFKDIENVSSEHGFKFGYSGLVFIIHGHEDVFFEFSSKNARDDCESVTHRRLDILKMESSISASSISGHEESFHTAEEKLRLARLRTYESKFRSSSDKIAVPENPSVLVETGRNICATEKPMTSFHITMVTIGSRGDVQPYISLAKGLMKEGHTCRIATHSEFREWVESYGIEFRDIAGDPGELMKIMIEHGMFSVSFLRDAASKFRGWIDELLHSAWEACQGTDIIIESPSAMAGIHVAEALKIPYFRAFTMPWTRTRTYPHAFMVPDQKMGGSYNHLTYVLFDNVFWKGISGQVNRWRVKELGLEKTNLELMRQQQVPFLYNVSPSVLVPPVDYSDWIKVTGYWFLDEGGAEQYEPPEDLAAFIKKARADKKKLVYIGFGSIIVSNSKEMTKCVIESVLNAGVRCILSKGWSERFDAKDKSQVEVELPPEIFQIKAAPHDWLFPQLDAAVHHGGSGTTGASLRAGLPTVIKPFFGDQFFYAGRVEDLGVGFFLKKLSVNAFSKAIVEVTTNQKIINKAALIGKKIRNERGVENAIAFLYWQLDYAHSIIQEREERRQRADKNEGHLLSLGTFGLGDDNSGAFLDPDQKGKILSVTSSLSPGNVVSGLLTPVGAVGGAVGGAIHRTFSSSSRSRPTSIIQRPTASQTDLDSGIPEEGEPKGTSILRKAINTISGSCNDKDEEPDVTENLSDVEKAHKAVGLDKMVSEARSTTGTSDSDKEKVKYAKSSTLPLQPSSPISGSNNGLLGRVKSKTGSMLSKPFTHSSTHSSESLSSSPVLSQPLNSGKPTQSADYYKPRQSNTYEPHRRSTEPPKGSGGNSAHSSGEDTQKTDESWMLVDDDEEST